ncbi:hypothetical protein C8Q78DRAFT_988606 [Trametes maxima]|nr:hypothetical protein C8Q78DRAFT_988606 [Trametes maxima]
MAPTSSTSSTEHHIPRSPNAYILYRKDFQDRLRSQGISLPWAIVSVRSAEAWHAETPEVSAHYKRLAAEAKVAHELQYPAYTFCPKKSGQRAAEKAARSADAAARKAEKKAEAAKKRAAAKAAKAASRAAGRQPRLAPTHAEAAAPTAGPSTPLAAALPPPLVHEPGDFGLLPPSGSRAHEPYMGDLAASWKAQGWVDPAVEDFWRGAGYEAPAVQFMGGLGLPPTGEIPVCADDSEESGTSLLAELYDGSAPFPAPFPSTPDFPSPPTAWSSPVFQTPSTPALTPASTLTPPSPNVSAGHELIWYHYDPATRRDVPFGET